MTLKGKMRSLIHKGLSISSDLAVKARAKAKDLGAMGALKLEIVQLQSRAGKATARLGNEVYVTLIDKDNTTVSREAPSISGFLKEIERLHHRIERKEKEYHSISGKTAAAS